MNYRRILTRKLAMVVPVAVIVALMIALVAMPASAFIKMPAQPGGGAVLNSPGPVPAMVNYQGYLTDSSGNPITGILSVTFSIYESVSGGTAVWTETHSSVNVTDGLFTVLLGSVTPIDPSNPTGGGYYLGIQVGSDPEMTPRQQLVSVPYALRSAVANDADTLDGLDSADFVAVAGDTMTGALTVAGTIESTSGGFKFPDGTTQTTSCEPQWPSIELGTIEFTINGDIQDPVALYGLTQHIMSGFKPLEPMFSSPPYFDEFSIIMKQGPLMPILIAAQCENKNIEVVIELWRPGETGEEHYMTITAEWIKLASIETVVESGESDPKMQEVSFGVAAPDNSYVSWVWEEGTTETIWGESGTTGVSVEYWTAGEGPGIPPLGGNEGVFVHSFSQKFIHPMEAGIPTGQRFCEGFVVSKDVDENTIDKSIRGVGGPTPMEEFSLTSWEYSSMSGSWEQKENYRLWGSLDVVHTLELEISIDNRGVLVEKVIYWGGQFTTWGYDGNEYTDSVSGGA